MTSGPVLVLGLLDLALIGALPRIFFRRGRLNSRWWLTAAPFLVAAGALLAALAGAAAATVALPGWTLHAAVGLHAGSILLIGVTLGTHREPPSLWHQPDDAPQRLVTHGAYARVRHPFYSAFMLALLGAALALPHPATWAALVLGLVQLDRTAAGEEERLAESALGAEYTAYIARTGRFLPPLRRRRDC